MIVIEVFVYVCIATLMVVCVNSVKKAGFAKRSDFIYLGVLLSLMTTQILIQMSPETRGPLNIITASCLGTTFALVLVYFLTRMTVATPERRENIRVWIGWTMFLVLGISFCLLLSHTNLKLPATTADLFRMPLALALCIGMTYYPPVLDRLTASKNDAEKNMEGNKESVVPDITTETGIEEHKEAVINLATEAWRIAKVFERTITQLEVDKPRRYTSQIKWFVKKAEESLENVGLRIVNVEGHPYDPGMAATPVNIEDFDVDDTLQIDLMIEPIIMEGTVLVKTGKVTLRKIEL